MKEIEQRIIEVLKKNTTVTTMLGYTFFDIDAFAKILESELSALRAEQGERGDMNKINKTVIGFDVLKRNSDIAFKQSIEALKKPVEQSKLSAEEFLNKMHSHDEYFDIVYKENVIDAMEDYHSQFEGKELPEEELRKELVKFEEYLSMTGRSWSDFAFEEELVDDYFKSLK